MLASASTIRLITGTHHFRVASAVDESLPRYVRLTMSREADAIRD